MRALWPGEPVTYTGRFSAFTDVTLAPRTRPGLARHLARRLEPPPRSAGRDGSPTAGSAPSSRPTSCTTASAVIVEAADEAGRQIDDDHYGTTLFATPDADEVPAELAALLRRRSELAVEDHLAVGPGGAPHPARPFRRGGRARSSSSSRSPTTSPRGSRSCARPRSPRSSISPPDPTTRQGDRHGRPRHRRAALLDLRLGDGRPLVRPLRRRLHDRRLVRRLDRRRRHVRARSRAAPRSPTSSARRRRSRPTSGAT